MTKIRRPTKGNDFRDGHRVFFLSGELQVCSSEKELRHRTGGPVLGSEGFSVVPLRPTEGIVVSMICVEGRSRSSHLDPDVFHALGWDYGRIWDFWFGVRTENPHENGLRIGLSS